MGSPPIRTPQPLQWDPIASKPGCICTDTSVFTKSNNNSWDTSAISSQPTNDFTIEILNSGGPYCNMMVGFAEKNLFYHSSICNYNNCGWFFNCYNWTLCSHKGQSNSPYQKNRPPLKQGDRVEAIYDSSNSQIRFKVNGSDLGVAYSGVTGELYASVDINGQNASVKLVDGN